MSSVRIHLNVLICGMNMNARKYLIQYIILKIFILWKVTNKRKKEEKREIHWMGNGMEYDGVKESKLFSCINICFNTNLLKYTCYWYLLLLLVLYFLLLKIKYNRECNIKMLGDMGRHVGTSTWVHQILYSTMVLIHLFRLSIIQWTSVCSVEEKY